MTKGNADKSKLTFIRIYFALILNLVSVSPAADEMNYFDFVGICDICLRPFFFADDIFIYLDGNPFSRQVEFF